MSTELSIKKKEEEIKSNCVPGIQTDKSIIRKKKKTVNIMGEKNIMNILIPITNI